MLLSTTFVVRCCFLVKVLRSRPASHRQAYRGVGLEEEPASRELPVPLGAARLALQGRRRKLYVFTSTPRRSHLFKSN